MNWLWPTKRRDETTLLVRAGRVVHWCAFGVGVFLFVGSGVAYAIQPEYGPSFSAIIAGFACVFGGRGIRYVLANE